MNTLATAARTLSLALCAAAALATSAAPAHAWWSEDPTWATGQLVDVQVRVDGSAAPLYVSPRTDDRHYLQAFAGRNYSLVLRNRSSQRVGVLIAVDGLNVVNGERSQLSGREPMYVLGPYESTTIQGWRTSLAEVRRFLFVDENRSYAERTGQANGDMGWIRVLAFREQRVAWEAPPRRWFNDPRGDARRQRADDAPRSPEAGNAPQAAPTVPPSAGGEGQALRGQATEKSDALGARDESGFPGTGWGDHRSDPVQQVEFTAERNATDTHVFRYEYAAGLRALGIFPSHPNRDRLRDRDNGELGFAKPPRW